jgi:flagellar protein FliO/FliZ
LGGEKLKASRPYTGVYITALFLFFSFFACIFPISAQTPEPLPASSTVDESTIILGEAPLTQITDGGSSIFVVIRMVVVLALSALAIYGVFFFVKRLARPQEIRDPNLKVLARVPISSDSFAAVVSVGAQAWLVAGGSGAVNLISEISDKESIEVMLLDDAKRTEEAGRRRYFDFSSLIKRFGPPQGKKSQGPGSFSDNLRMQQERLKRL